MKKIPTLFLQTVIVLIGIGVLTFLLVEPNLEGVNAHATLTEIYFHDPFLAYVYVGSIPFFVALYQAFQVLGYAGRDQLFSPIVVRAVRMIRSCALITAGAIMGAVAFIGITARNGTDDPAGFVMLGFVTTLLSLATAAAATVGGRALQRAVSGAAMEHPTA